MTVLRYFARRLDPAPPHKRAHRRYELHFKLSLRIIIPEETQTPLPLTAHAVDVSHRGMRICVDNMSPELYRKLMRHNRMTKISFPHPFSEDSIQINGWIMSLDFHKTESDDPFGSCYLGIRFDDNEEELEKYEKFVDSLELV